jgi:hypothetical protein
VVGRRSYLAPALALVAIGAGAAGCGGGDPSEVLSETAANLGKIRSGNVDARFAVGAGSKGKLGFELQGPFALPRRPGLPTARVDYVQLAGEREAEVTLVSTGREAFVEVDGTAYRLPERRKRALRLGGDLRSAAGGGLRLERWVRDPKLGPGPASGGAETERIVGELDVAEAVNGLLGLADRAGAAALGLRSIGSKGASEVEAGSRSRVEVVTGAEDRLLRSLSVDLSLDPRTVADEGERGAGADEPIRIELDLKVDRANAAVRVRAPRDPRPADELPGSE